MIAKVYPLVYPPVVEFICSSKVFDRIEKYKANIENKNRLRHLCSLGINITVTNTSLKKRIFYRPSNTSKSISRSRLGKNRAKSPSITYF